MKHISFLFGLFFLGWAQAQIEETTIELVSESFQVQSILKEAEDEFTQTLITEILGEANTEKIKTSIEKKILPKTKNFILLTKILDKKEQEQNQDSDNEVQKFIYSIFIKYSKDTLKDVLIQEGIYYANQGAHRILPLIQFIEEDNKNAWWTPSASEQSTSVHIQDFYSPIQKLFIQNGFFLIDPLFSQYAHHLPKELNAYYINPKKAQKIAQHFEAQFFILGKIKITSLSDQQYQSVWNLTLYSTPHLRKLDSYKSRIELQKKSWSRLSQRSSYWAKNFILQIKDIYETGSLSTQLFNIEISGNLTYLERDHIRKALIKDIPNIKNLKTHYISAQKERYKADVEGTDQEVLNKIKNWKFLDFKFSPYLKSENYIIIQTKKK